MRTLNSSNARLVFIIDNDYGELTMAMFFLHGQDMATRATLLLPPRLYATNGKSLPVRTSPYHSYEDLVRTIEEENPDIVFLFSGYLLPIHQLLTTESLGNLVDRLRSRGCRVVTYDPFWGLMAAPHEVFGAHYLQSGNSLGFVKLGRYALARLSATFKTLCKTADILRKLIHVNPAPIDTQQVRAAHFFNPGLIDLRLNDDLRVSDDRPYWMFILSKEDYVRQKTLHGRPSFPFSPLVGGRERFAEITIETLRQTVQAGRHPILLAPDDFITAVKERMSGTDNAGLIAFCPYDQFLSLLFRAEYVFYWNAISSSSLIRVVNSLPVFYFDRGHIGEGLEPVYKRTVQLYYLGWEPTYLDQKDSLKSDVLADLAVAYRQATTHIRENLQSAPTPEEMIEDILNAP